MRALRAFTLVEVVIALGIVGFSVLAVVALLSIANETNRAARGDAFAARIAYDELQHIEALSAANFPRTNYTKYYTANLTDLGSAAPANGPAAIYELTVMISTPPDPKPADHIFNFEVRYPYGAPATNQTKVEYTALVNQPPA